MATSMQQPHLIVAKGRSGLFRPLLVFGVLVSALTLNACQTAPSSVSTPSGAATTSTSVILVPTAQLPTTQAPTSNDTYTSPNKTTTTPYSTTPESQGTPPSDSSMNTNNPLTQKTPIIQQQPEVIFNEPVIPTRDDYIISKPPTTPSHNDLLERARQNSQQQSPKATTNQSDLPAFRNLMQTGTNQLKSGNLTAAENSFTRAQRLAPRSSAVYFYLSQVALKKNQPRKAEAMARRGLAVSQDASRRRALWQLILHSGQQQNNSRVIREAQQALK